ncbi:HPP family protein [Xylariaceae sp. FL0016]|nr:HPP family protein [Xylariaceae sp. FL0016]
MPPPWHWNHDIDDWLNRLVPRPPWAFIPYPIAYFLGHRKDGQKAYGNLWLLLVAFIGVFCSILLIEAITHQIPQGVEHGPLIIASFGAAAVLEFAATSSPFAQPRNCFIGQLFAAVIGVSYAKIFQMSPRFESIRWLGGALSCASVTVLMGVTKTIHPPAGATALIAVVDDTVIELGWDLVPLIILGCTIMTSVALIVNNIFSRFPLYWWTASDLTPQRPNPTLEDGEKGSMQHIELNITRDQVLILDVLDLSHEEKILLERLCGRMSNKSNPS